MTSSLAMALPQATQLPTPQALQAAMAVAGQARHRRRNPSAGLADQFPVQPGGGQLIAGWKSTYLTSGNTNSPTLVEFTSATNANVTDPGYSNLAAPDSDTFVWNATDTGAGATDTLRYFLA
jgi:hypothetical protein